MLIPPGVARTRLRPTEATARDEARDATEGGPCEPPPVAGGLARWLPEPDDRGSERLGTRRDARDALIRAEAPYIGTGIEKRAAGDAAGPSLLCPAPRSYSRSRGF